MIGEIKPNEISWKFKTWAIIWVDHFVQNYFEQYKNVNICFGLYLPGYCFFDLSSFHSNFENLWSCIHCCFYFFEGAIQVNNRIWKCTSWSQLRLSCWNTIFIWTICFCVYFASKIAWLIVLQRNLEIAHFRL